MIKTFGPLDYGSDVVVVDFWRSCSVKLVRSGVVHKPDEELVRQFCNLCIIVLSTGIAPESP